MRPPQLIGLFGRVVRLIKELQAYAAELRALDREAVIEEDETPTPTWPADKIGRV
jgi:hypothetical protein